MLWLTAVGAHVCIATTLFSKILATVNKCPCAQYSTKLCPAGLTVSLAHSGENDPIAWSRSTGAMSPSNPCSRPPAPSPPAPAAAASTPGSKDDRAGPIVRLLAGCGGAVVVCARFTTSLRFLVQGCVVASLQMEWYGCFCEAVMSLSTNLWGATLYQPIW